MEIKRLIYSPGRVSLGVIAPVLTQLNIPFDLACWRDEALVPLRCGILLDTPSTELRLRPPVVMSPDLSLYQQIFVSVGFPNHRLVLNKIRKFNPRAEVIFLENILCHEMVTSDTQVRYVVVDRIVSFREFMPNGVRVIAEDFLALSSDVKVLKGHVCHHTLSADKREFEQKFLAINLLHKAISLLAMRENLVSCQEFLSLRGSEPAFKVLESVVGGRLGYSLMSMAENFINRIELAPIEELSRVINPTGQDLLRSRLIKMNLNVDVIDVLIKEARRET